MSFEVLLVGADAAVRVPRKSEVLRAFQGHILGLSDSVLTVGSAEDGQCEILGTWDSATDPEQFLVTIVEPIRARWLWDGVLELLQGFDLFLMIPSEPDAYGAIARPDVTIPPEVRKSYRFVEAASADDLIALAESPPG